MKKTLLIFSITLLCTTLVKAQYDQKTRILFYAEGGLNYTSLYNANKNTSLNVKSILGPELGGYMRVLYPTLVGFDIGANYAQRGAKFSDSSSTAKLNYAYLYMDGLYHFKIIGDNDIFAGIGFFGGYAINGKFKDQNITFGDTWKKGDFGLQLKTGVNFKDIFSVGLKYDISFIPTFKSIDYRGEASNGRNSALTLNASIRFLRFEK